MSKPARAVGSGDVLTFAQERHVRVVKILACGSRRGPPNEAQLLYEDLSPAPDPSPVNPRFDGSGRPTGKDRRDIMAARHGDDPFALE